MRRPYSLYIGLVALVSFVGGVVVVATKERSVGNRAETTGAQLATDGLEAVCSTPASEDLYAKKYHIEGTELASVCSSRATITFQDKQGARLSTCALFLTATQRGADFLSLVVATQLRKPTNDPKDLLIGEGLEGANMNLYDAFAHSARQTARNSARDVWLAAFLELGEAPEATAKLISDCALSYSSNLPPGLSTGATVAQVETRLVLASVCFQKQIAGNLPSDFKLDINGAAAKDLATALDISTKQAEAIVDRALGETRKSRPHETWKDLCAFTAYPIDDLTELRP
jgi:hypothetical protein